MFFFFFLYLLIVKQLVLSHDSSVNGKLQSLFSNVLKGLLKRVQKKIPLQNV